MQLTIPSAPLNLSLTSTPDTLGTMMMTATNDPPESDGNSPIIGYIIATPSAYDSWGYFYSTITTPFSQARIETVGTYARRGLAAINAVGQGPYSGIASVLTTTDKYTVTRTVGPIVGGVPIFTTIVINLNPATMVAPPDWTGTTGFGDVRNLSTWDFWGPQYVPGNPRLTVAQGATVWEIRLTLYLGGENACSVTCAYPGIKLTNGERFFIAALFRDLSPTAPVLNTVTGVNNGLEIAFTPAVPSSEYTSPPTNFVHEYSIDGGATTYIANTIGTTFTIPDLTNSIPYDVQLRATNLAPFGAGGAVVGPWSNVLSGTPIVPPPPPAPDWAPYRTTAVSDRIVRVEFDPITYSDIAPWRYSSTGIGDATNPRTWGVLQMHSDTPSSSGVPMTVLSVTVVSPWIYELALLQKFVREGSRSPDNSYSYPVHLSGQFQVSASVLRFDDGTTKSVMAYGNISLDAADLTPNSKTAALGLSLKDVANVSITPIGSLMGGDYSEFLSGTLLINAGGDYATQSGESLLRKLIMRRLISKKGDFFHLPDYGASLGEKATFSTANLRSLAKDIEMQVLLEPEIERAKATLTYQAATGSLIIQVQARMRSTGQQTSLSMTLPLAGTQF